MKAQVRVLEVLGRSAGGIARHVADVRKGLDVSCGLKLEVAGPADLPPHLPRPEHELDIPDGFVGHRRAAARLRDVVTVGAYDVVHAHGLRAGMDSCIATRDRKTRCVVTFHNLALPDAPAIRRILQKRAERSVLARADRVLAPSREIAAHLKEVLPQSAGRIEVLHVSIPTPPATLRNRDVVRSELGVPDGEPLIVSVGRFAPQKDLPTMIDALARLGAGTLALVGDGPLRADLEGFATERGVSTKVRFVGFKDSAHDYVSAADVFCLSSDWEAVSLAAQEAVSLGVPVVATAVGGIGEL
ncbi:MAG: hypothetical protein QOH90_1265, partial [Actinomycetota bacterium]|nr:hypothetical protein [Actinomycetota bacterium]